MVKGLGFRGVGLRVRLTEDEACMLCFLEAVYQTGAM